MYVNAYILSVPEKKKGEYVHIAKIYAELAKEYGAIEIFENWELACQTVSTLTIARQSKPSQVKKLFCPGLSGQTEKRLPRHIKVCLRSAHD